jgi:biotin operon repressor
LTKHEGRTAIDKGSSQGRGLAPLHRENVEKHPSDISKITAQRFDVTRQAVNEHLQRLTSEGCLTETGQTRNRVYKLAPLAEWSRSYQIVPGLAEDVVWADDIRGALGQLPDNVMNIWHHGYTEMFNNAVDHSEGKWIHVTIRRTASATEMMVTDDGVGIFRKIQAALGLLDERHAILELSKGKLTTDPKRHSELLVINVKSEVRRMIDRAPSAKDAAASTDQPQGSRK